MREKLLSLMRSEELTSSRLAELLGIQPSGISHILSGRNKPSFDFVQKILRRFPTINPDWLILDQGPMYRDNSGTTAATTSTSPASLQQIPQLFTDVHQQQRTPQTSTEDTSSHKTDAQAVSSDVAAVSAATSDHGNVKRIIILYDDHTFDSYNPSR